MCFEDIFPFASAAADSFDDHHTASFEKILAVEEGVSILERSEDFPRESRFVDVHCTFAHRKPDHEMILVTGWSLDAGAGMVVDPAADPGCMNSCMELALAVEMGVLG